VFENPNESKPLGARNYRRFNDSIVIIPEGLKFNKVNCFMSIIFFDDFSIRLNQFNQNIRVSGVDQTSCFVNVQSDVSYWQIFMTNILYNLNLGPKDSNDKQQASITNKSTSVSGSRNIGTRGFSSFVGSKDMRLVESYFSNTDDLVL